MSKKQYSDAEKAEYWKKKAMNKNVQNSSYKKTRKAYKKGYKKYEKKEREPGLISAGGNALGGALGTALGGAPGAAIGSFLGGKLGHLVETITGFGDYQVEQNSIMKGGMTVPQVVNSMDKGGVVIRHREYIMDIKPTDVFTKHVFPLNPGQAFTFPWLSRAASLFDQYRFRGLLFEFKSTSSDAVLSSGNSTALGSVCMATDYDILDKDYSNKREMLNSMFANSTKPSCSIIHPIECKTSLSPMRLQYVRTANTYPPGGDPRMYDLGKTIIATEGQQNTSALVGAIGEIWVTYEVELFKQQLPENVVKTDHFKINAPVAAGWLGPAANLHGGDIENSIGGKINDAGNAYLFPDWISEGRYMISYFIVGTSASVGQIAITPARCSLVDIWNASTTFVQAPGMGTTSATLMASFIIDIEDTAPTLTFGNAVIPTAGIADLWITEINDNLTDFDF